MATRKNVMVGNLRQIDLNTENGKNHYEKARGDYQVALPKLQTFLDEGAKTPLLLNRMPFYDSGDGDVFVCLRNKEVLTIGSRYDNINFYDLTPPRPEHVSDAYVMQHGKKSLLLLNGDNGGSDNKLIDTNEFNEMPTISFTLLDRFYKNKTDTVVKKVNEEKLQIVDFSPDHTIALTKAEKALLKKAENDHKAMEKLRSSPPVAGYSLLHDKWHRSATVLLYDSQEKITILMGQDEGTYFGVELADNPKTLKDAYESLVPKEVKGKPYKRQGEWFVINVNEKKVPELKDCIGEFESITLPRESDDSNKHDVCCTEGRLSSKGVIYALNPTVEHPDHEQLDMTGWCNFYRNTAVRSYSEEGVD